MIDTCITCHVPTHASESDDEGRCATCAVALAVAASGLTRAQIDMALEVLADLGEIDAERVAAPLPQDIDAAAASYRDAHGEIVDAEYEPGVPGRACLACQSGWPASEPDGEPWHHAVGCPVG